MRLPHVASWFLVSLVLSLVLLAPEANSQAPIVSKVGNSARRQLFAGWVSLTWQASISDSVVGYNVYRGKTSGGPYRKINRQLDFTTSYTDGACDSGQTYYYVTTAVNAAGEESAYSNEAQAVIP